MSESLKFFFTPVDEPQGDRPNPHAKETTRLPEVIEALHTRFGDSIRGVEEYAGEQTVVVERTRLLEICGVLKSELGFDYLADMGGIDRFTEEERFEVFYNLVSLEGHKRLRVKVRVEEDEPVVDSVVSVWPAADWNERECYDMFGIRFAGHPDLRRMLLPEDFEYFPLRKEFPPLGIPGSLPIPSYRSDGEVVADPYAAASRPQPTDE
jgi:NADH-quinone oxidoreductase subunit C